MYIWVYTTMFIGIYDNVYGYMSGYEDGCIYGYMSGYEDGCVYGYILQSVSMCM